MTGLWLISKIIIDIKDIKDNYFHARNMLRILPQILTSFRYCSLSRWSYSANFLQVPQARIFSELAVKNWNFCILHRTGHFLYVRWQYEPARVGGILLNLTIYVLQHEHLFPIFKHTLLVNYTLLHTSIFASIASNSGTSHQ
jgi:hypothetical protein